MSGSSESVEVKDAIWHNCIDCLDDSTPPCGSPSCRCKAESGCRCEKDSKYHRFDDEHQKVSGAALDDEKRIRIPVGGGDNPKVFQVHEVLLRSSSSFFEKALGGDWKESKEKMVPLPDEDVEIFSIYQKWLLLNKLLINSRNETPREAMGVHLAKDFETDPESSSVTSFEARSTNIFNTLLECYILGDHLMDSKFKNAIVDEILDLISRYYTYPIEWASVLPKRLPESCGLVRLFEDIWIRQAKGYWLDDMSTDNMDDISTYLVSLAKKALDFRSQKILGLQHRCKYYDGICKKSCRKRSYSTQGSFSDVLRWDTMRPGPYDILQDSRPGQW
ncbi:hypothetical protein IWX50DRAFT_682018 [Phyllosticta citricarpa]